MLHNLAAPQTDLQRAVRWRSTASPASRRRWPRSRRTTTPTSTSSSPPSRAWRRSIEEANGGGPPSLEQAIYSLPYQAPFTENVDRIHAPAASERGDPRRKSPRRSATHSSVGAINLKAATTLNKELAESSQALAEFGSNPVVNARASKTSPRRSKSATRCSPGIAPAQSVLQLLDARLPQPREPAVRERRQSARSPAQVSCSRRPGPTTRATPPRRLANGPSEEHELEQARAIIDNNHLHANPYPNTAGPGQPQLCEAGNENYIVGKAIIGNLPAAQVSKNREITSREPEPVRRNVPLEHAQGARHLDHERQEQMSDVPVSGGSAPVGGDGRPPDSRRGPTARSDAGGAAATKSRSSSCSATTRCASG